MRKLNVQDYDVVVSIDEAGVETKKPYKVKRSIETVMLNTGPQTKQTLNARQLRRNLRIFQKIESAEKFALLEEAEYSQLLASFEAFQMFGVNDAEMVNRVLDCPTVSVEESKRV